MGSTYPAITDDMRSWLENQPVFFVATAPLAEAGHVNCSPKGLDSFRVLDPLRVAYLDMTGSGVETIAHLRENGRIVLMFCAFSGPARIVRLYGRGSVHEAGSPGCEKLIGQFSGQLGQRAIIEISLTRIADSCGYGVPRMELVGPRDTLEKYYLNKGPEGMIEYRRQKNAASIDGLPGLES